MQEWKKELCIEKPETLQEIGSNVYIQRRNIEVYEKEQDDGTKVSGYSCECRILSKAEYASLKEQEESASDTSASLLTTMEAQADIYEKLMETESNQLTIMQAIADLYEAQNGGN